MPVKFPASHEPVVPENVDEIYIVTGLCAVGKPLKEVCHRRELVRECLGVSEETMLTDEHLRKLLQKGYLEPLKMQYPKAKLSVWFNDYKKN
jgi:xanthine dehydrogenase accessory factor